MSSNLIKYVLLTITVALALALAPTVVSQDRGVRVQASASARRVALVIGNSAYPDFPLRNTLNDAEDVANALRNLGFEVIHKKNLKLGEMKRAVGEFRNKLHGAGVGLFYFAGHGVQVNGENYLIPTDAEMSSEETVEAESLGLNRLIAEMAVAGSETNIIILDACRSVPLARRIRSPERGLAQVAAKTGMLIAYATAPGSVAGDGEERNGVYTRELLRNIRTPDITVEELLRRVRLGVYEKTGGRQLPWESSSLFKAFYFVEGTAKTAPPPGNAVPPSGRDPASKELPSGAQGTSPTLKASVDSVEFSLEGCVFSKADMTAECALEVRNVGRKRDVMISGLSKELPNTVLTDAYGNQYRPAEVRYRGLYSNSSLFLTLESGVSYRVQLKFLVGPGFGASSAVKSLTVEWALGETGTHNLNLCQALKFENGPVLPKKEPTSMLGGASKQEQTAPRLPSEPGAIQRAQNVPVTAVQSGPNNLRPTYHYPINGGTAKLVLKAEVVSTNDDDELAQVVTHSTHDLSSQGSHVWDNEWYYRRLRPEENLLLAWGAESSLGWLLVRKEGNDWWYRTNSSQWQPISVGVPKKEFWMVGRTKVSIWIEIPRQEGGWTANDVKYKFGT